MGEQATLSSTWTRQHMDPSCLMGEVNAALPIPELVEQKQRATKKTKRFLLREWCCFTAIVNILVVMKLFPGPRKSLSKRSNAGRKRRGKPGEKKRVTNGE